MNIQKVGKSDIHQIVSHKTHNIIPEVNKIRKTYQVLFLI